VTVRPNQPAPVMGVDALLADGSVVTVRSLTSEDLPALLELNREASDRSRRMRYFLADQQHGERYLRHLAEPGQARLAVVAERCSGLLGVASAEVFPVTDTASVTTTAEVAVFVADRWQHVGVGTILLEHLSTVARVAGLERFSARVPADNTAMFAVFLHAGFDVELGCGADGTVRVTLDLLGGRAQAAAVAGRERRATVATLRPILSPRSVIVIGASRRPGSVGHAVLANLRLRNFAGGLAVVNQRAVPGEMICGSRAYRSVSTVPWRADLAVIAVPAAETAAVLEDCGRAGVRGAVVLASDSAPTDDHAGPALARIARRHGIRLVGPGCLGVLNTAPEIRLDATYAKSTSHATARGAAGFATQSGALGIAILDAAAQRGLGVSTYVSLGGKADVSGNDLLLYWADDPRTQVIALGLESIGNPRRFRRIAASIARTKPIVALRSRRSAAGGALLHDAGVIAVDTTAELIDVVALLAQQPVPAGRRMVIIGNARGPGALAAIAAAGTGAILPELSTGLAERLRGVIGPDGAVGNPLDLEATASPELYRAVLELVLGSGESDAVVVLHVVTAAHRTGDVVRAVQQATSGLQAGSGGADLAPITVAGVLIGAVSPRGGELPWFGAAEAAAHAVARAADLADWRAESLESRSGPAEVVLPPDIDIAAVTELLATAPRSDDGWLSSAAAVRLLRLIGVPVASEPDQAEPDQAEPARIPRTRSPGLELLVALQSPLGGIPLVIVGAGGIHEAVYADRVLRTLPLAPTTANRMLGELRCAPLLTGHRGSPALDRAAVADVLERISGLDLIAPQIRELEVNPLLVMEHGVHGRGVRIRCPATVVKHDRPPDSTPSAHRQER